jgi:hypothetical protein
MYAAVDQYQRIGEELNGQTKQVGVLNRHL